MAVRMFIYELPYSIRKSLCRILDPIDKWEELGGEHMGFDYTYLQYIRRKDSPTDELLTAWGNQNHTVNDLFVLLSKMQQYRAMALLKDLVQEQYRHLLREGEELMNRPLSNKNETDKGNPNEKNQKVNGVDQACVAQKPVTGAARLSEAASPVTFTDNKDLGLDLHNINLAGQKPSDNAKAKTVKEVKIQNIPDNKENQYLDHNCNAQNIDSISQSQAPRNPNLNAQLNSSTPQRPAQERKLSNSSVTSSVMEGCTPLIEYEELEVATNYWDPTYILGKGGFGTVYKGTWKNTQVAVKKLDAQKDQPMQSSQVNTQESQSMRELRYLNSHRHDNILSLYGYCFSNTAACLVYQYMANGSLEDRLHCKQNTRPLNWAQRLNIMTGTARGIQFLHSLGKTPLVHGDIKSANILLDGNFEPRLGDFGLAREGPLQQYTHVKVSSVHGTRPYLPDEFLRGKQFSVKVDTYSFGVVLFEVATGLRAYDENRKKKFLKDHIVSYVGDLCALADSLAGLDYCSSASGLLTLGRHCVVTNRNDRPDMTSVLNDVNMLYNIYKSAERATSLARQRSLTPTNPLEMQVAHDELRNFSPLLTVQGSPQPQRPLTPCSPQILINGAASLNTQLPLVQQPFLFPTGSPEAQIFTKGMGLVQVVPIHQTGLPQPIIIHHPPSTGLPTPPQNECVYKPPSHLDSNDMPLVTLLRNKPTGDDTEAKAPVTPKHSSSSVQELSTESIRDSIDSSSSNAQEEKSRESFNDLTNSSPQSDPDFCVSLPTGSLSDSAYLPCIPDLLSIKPL